MTLASGLDIGSHEGARVALPTDDTGTTPGGNGGPPSALDDIRSGIKAWFDVGVSIGSSLDRMEKTWRQLTDRMQRNTPVDYGNVAAAPFPAAGALCLVLGTPDQGTRWEVTGCVVGGADFDTTVAGSAGLYVSPQVPIQGAHAPAGLTALADRAATLPNIAFYSTRQLVVNDQEYLFLVIVGGTPGQIYAANFSVTVFNTGAGGGKDVNVL